MHASIVLRVAKALRRGALGGKGHRVGSGMDENTAAAENLHLRARLLPARCSSAVAQLRLGIRSPGGRPCARMRERYCCPQLFWAFCSLWAADRPNRPEPKLLARSSVLPCRRRRSATVNRRRRPGLPSRCRRPIQPPMSSRRLWRKSLRSAGAVRAKGDQGQKGKSRLVLRQCCSMRKWIGTDLEIDDKRARLRVGSNSRRARSRRVDALDMYRRAVT